MYDWTLTAVKHRESLDKQDKRDVAQSVFAQDRDARLAPHMVFLRSQTLEHQNDEEAFAEQIAANEVIFRLALIDDLLSDGGNDVAETDRAVLMTGVEMTRTEFDLFLTLTQVYDHSHSHFIFEICEPSTKRFLNALRIRHEEGGVRMPWSLYKTALLERMQNSSTIDGLISFILKPRDSNCPISLWVAERIAERRLLNDDEQGRCTANRVAELFLAGQDRTRALREARAASLRGSGRWADPGSSSSSVPSWPRKRRKWYAVCGLPSRGMRPWHHVGCQLGRG